MQYNRISHIVMLMLATDSTHGFLKSQIGFTALADTVGIKHISEYMYLKPFILSQLFRHSIQLTLSFTNFVIFYLPILWVSSLQAK